MKVKTIQRSATPAVVGVVVVHSGSSAPDSHDCVTRASLARELSALLGYSFAGEYDSEYSYPGKVYHIPRDTVIGRDTAKALGIEGESDLFGGVAPHSFVATKTISHPLVRRDAQAPDGWSQAFSDAVAPHVLSGYSAFCIADATEAGVRMLADGPVRVKRALGIGGRGQTVVSDARGLAEALAAIDASEIGEVGVSLEQDLGDVVTYSIGQVRVGNVVATYHGRQRQTRSNAGHEVYGGSELVVVRGDYDVLLALPAPAPVLAAVEHARRYHLAAIEHYPGMILSRANYDVAEGTDAQGRRCCGVLEQSWRLGGASGAEMGALAAFARDPALVAVRASCIERYGDLDEPLPPDATVHFRDVDPQVGPLTKYTLVEPHVDPR